MLREEDTIMDSLWAPWRLAYVAAPKASPSTESCFICEALAAQEDRERLLIWRDPPSLVMLNRFPYNNGHLLIAPCRHTGRLDDLTNEELLHSMQTLRRFQQLLEELMRPNGYNIGLNLGSAAGAGLPGHLHWHLVPRWNGDTNFMPVLSDTKVMVQSLDTLYQLLADRLYGPAAPGSS